MKKRTKTIFILLAALVVLAAALLLWQRDNLAALKMSLDYSRDDLSQMMEENNQRVDAVSDALNGVTVRDLTEEEKAALQEGALTPEELVDRLVGTQTVPEPEVPEEPSVEDPTPTPEGSVQPSVQPAPEPSDQPSPTPDAAPTPTAAVSAAPTPTPAPAPSQEQEKRDRLARCIAEIYVMKTEYTAWLESTHQAAIDEFVALPVEQQTTARKYEIGMRYMRAGLAKEDECDRKMADLEGEILALLRELGEDTALVTEIQTAYEEEKALKKAYYLGLHD